jgi:FkbM family methyltransferase
MLDIIKLIYFHPLNKGRRLQALVRFVKWQLISRVYKHPILLPFTNKSKYLAWKGLAGLTGNWYNGLMEMEEMSFLLHFLRDGDSFFDIGANVGAYSILASQHFDIAVHAFEPHPLTFKHLTRNINIQDKINNSKLYNIALGDSEGSVLFTSQLDTVNHIVTENKNDAIEVKIQKLDSMNLPPPILVKIDVEGYEWNVLNGATQILCNTELKAIIIELNGSGTRYGINDDQIDSLLRSHSFIPYTYDPFQRCLIKLDKWTNHNTIYIRGIDFCEQRVKNSHKIILSNGVEL